MEEEKRQHVTSAWRGEKKERDEDEGVWGKEKRRSRKFTEVK